MAEENITYWKVGGPPADWDAEYKLFDTETGEDISSGVVEVDSEAGWLIRNTPDGDKRSQVCYGDDDCLECKEYSPEKPHVKTEKIEGTFEIRL